MKLGPNQQKLVNALRSGKYKQAFGTLQDGTHLCAVGVACVEAEAAGVTVQRDEDGTLSAPILQGRTALHFGIGYFSSIIELNDRDRFPFVHIADELETNPHIYFEKSK